MNYFFINKIEKLREGFGASDVGSHSATPEPQSGHLGDLLVLSPPSPSEVIRAIKGLKQTKASWEDGLTVWVLQLAAPMIALPVAHLIALSLAQARIPLAFKAAIVVPIHKGKGKPANHPSSYRPVAILPALSKVLEKVVHSQLAPFLERRLPECQFGFHPNRSSFSAVATAHGAWARASSAGRTTGVAAFDLTAAFDTVDHDILCNKLSQLGVQVGSVKWFRNYLEGRHKRVSYLGTASSPSKLRYGVPQGSILGPVLFLVLIHDLPAALGINTFPNPTCGTVGYADDVVVWLSGTSTESVRPLIESTAASVVTYMAANCLSLNPEKTQVLWINSGKESPVVSVGSARVPPSNTINILGMQFDSGLRADPHVQELITSVASMAGIARRLRVHIPPDMVADVVKALLVGKISYGAAAVLFPRLDQDWPRSAFSSALQVRVNDLARVICGVRRSDRCSIASLLARSGLPSVNRLSVRSVAMEAWKSLGPQGDPDRDPLTSIFGQPTATNTRAVELGIRKPATRFPINTFVNSATLIWNRCYQLRSASSIGAAKRAATSFAEACPL